MPSIDALTLGGTDTLADYQRVLRSVAYSSGSVDPTQGHPSAEPHNHLGGE